MNRRMTFSVVDSRVCWRCGARAGGCSHIERDDYEITVAVHSAGSEPRPPRWSPEDDAALRWYWENGRTSYQIADLLGRTRSAVSNRIIALGIQRWAA